MDSAIAVYRPVSPFSTQELSLLRKPYDLCDRKAKDPRPHLVETVTNKATAWAGVYVTRNVGFVPSLNIYNGDDNARIGRMSTMLAPSTWMTVCETADFLGISVGRVRQLLLENSLSGEKFGNTWAIARSEVERFAKLDRPSGNPQFQKKKRRSG